MTMINAIFGLMVAKKPALGRQAAHGKGKAKNPLRMHPLRLLTMAVLVIVVICIGALAARSLTMYQADDAPAIQQGGQPTSLPDQGYLAPAASSTPSVTPQPLFTARPDGTTTVSPTATPAPCLTPTPAPTATATLTATPTPTAAPTPTPTATPAPAVTATPTPEPTIDPSLITPDQDFYEHITPIKDADRGRLRDCTNSYQSGDGPLYVDLFNSYMGSPYAYPGDTIGIKMRLYNDGPALDTVATVQLNISKNVYGNVWIDNVITQQYYTHISADADSAVYKNFSVTVPTDNPSLAGFYRIDIKFYANGHFMSGATKEINLL